MNDLSFCKFHFPDNINKVIWEITNQCNYSCEYCIFSSTGKKPRGELSFSKIKETLEDLKLIGFNYIKFTGGEPFIRDDFIDILIYAKSIGFNFDISTNASFITEEISQKLSFLDINFIHVSLDGYDLKSHEFVRGKKSFNKTIKGLNNLLKYNRNIRIGCVIHSKNDNFLHKVVKLCNDFKVKEVIFSMMSPIGRMNKNSASISLKSPESLISIINSISSNYTKVNHNLNSDIKVISFDPVKSQNECPGVSKFLFIDSIGTVSPCTWVSENFPEFHMLSLHSNSLSHILNNKLFQNFNYQKSLLKGKCFAFSYKNNNLFDKIYSFATENISFIEKLPFKNFNTALVVTGSGDQAISVAEKGFKEIICVDINYLAKHYTELKIAALKVLPFSLFISFFKNHEYSFDYKIYKMFNHLLSPETEKFWNQHYINSQYNGSIIRSGELFNHQYDDWNIKVFNVPYLQSEEKYLIYQNKIFNCKFSFFTNDFLDYHLTKSFDLVLLSNISDYSHKMFNDDYIKHFKTFYVEKFLPFLDNKGILMFSYLYDFENIGNSYLRNKMNLPSIRKMYFKEFNYKEIIIPSAIQNFKHDVSCYIQK